MAMRPIDIIMARRASGDPNWNHIPEWNMMTKPATHFVGFRDPQRWQNAVQLFGQPDFVHVAWDQRAQCEVAPCDTVVFAKGDASDTPLPFNFDDSNQADDPAARERLEMNR